jgi:hypothetical protein
MIDEYKRDHSTQTREIHRASITFPDRRKRPVVVAQNDGAGSCPTCAAGSAGTVGPPAYVYAVGTIEMRLPSPGIEKEFRQTIANGSTANLTQREVQYNILRQNRHLANEVCWVLRIENVDTYILVPRDSWMLDEFVNAVAPAERKLDLDVVIGTRGPLAPAELCNGLVVPIVLVDQVYSFQQPDLMRALRKPEGSSIEDETFEGSSTDLFERIQQLADNVGATDEHRALNYLAVRSESIYTHTSGMYGREFDLTDVEVILSRLSGTRKLVDVIFTYTNRNTDVVEKYYLRVDVTEKYPFLDKKLSPFFDRQ